MIVKLPKQILAWTEEEFMEMLRKNQEFHMAGLARGKQIKRAARFEGVRKHAQAEERFRPL